jgi:hypothetical protein
VLGLAALFLAAASANASPSFTSTAPWWEKVTFTISGDGANQTCRYESSLASAAAESCGSEDEPASLAHDASGSTSTLTKITIERRFTPGTTPQPVDLNPGETLLGGQLMALDIDGGGKVLSCRVVGSAGDVKPPYGCDEARAERFQASASSTAQQLRHGLMTVFVYGHEEYLV